jgi:hypothetical protein
VPPAPGIWISGTFGFGLSAGSYKKNYYKSIKNPGLFSTISLFI